MKAASWENSINSFPLTQSFIHFFITDTGEIQSSMNMKKKYGG